MAGSSRPRSLSAPTALLVSARYARLRTTAPRYACDKKSRSRQLWVTGFRSDESNRGAAVSRSARWWLLSWTKHRLAPAGGGVLDRRPSARRLGTNTAIEAIVRQDAADPRMEPRDPPGRCCCVTPVRVTPKRLPLCPLEADDSFYPMAMMLATDGIPAVFTKKSMYAPGGAT
jgi:hypothetical protein